MKTNNWWSVIYGAVWMALSVSEAFRGNVSQAVMACIISFLFLYVGNLEAMIKKLRNELEERNAEGR